MEALATASAMKPITVGRKNSQNGIQRVAVSFFALFRRMLVAETATRK